MRNIFRLFKYDFKHLFGNVISVVIVLGLVALPSLFTFYNVIACWDVFANTGNLKVAVANTDKGYESDLISLNINVGDTVVQKLRENDQLDWVFVDEETAVEGAKSGEYYAAVVIPEDFSHDMFSFYSSDTEHARIVYYTNEKKNAVAPRVTDQGADQVSAQINSAFTETISDILLTVVDSAGSIIESGDSDGQIADISSGVRTAGSEMTATANLLATYSQLIDSAQRLISSSATLLGSAQEAVAVAGDAVQDGKTGATQMADALKVSADAMDVALKNSIDAFDGTSENIDAVYADANATAEQSAIVLRTQAAATQTQIDTFNQLYNALDAYENSNQLSDEQKAMIVVAKVQIQVTIASLEGLESSLYTAADNVGQAQTDAAADRAELQAQLDEAKKNVQQLEDQYNNELKPELQNLATQVAEAVASLEASTATLNSISNDLISSSQSLSSQLDKAKLQIASSAEDLTTTGDKLNELADAINEALASGDIQQIKDVIGNDPARLAEAISAPVGVERIPVFEAENFGSAMAPLYTTLALWVGSLLTMVLLNCNVSQQARDYVAGKSSETVPEEGGARLEGPARTKNPRRIREYQMFFGRYLIVFLIATMQSMMLAAGNAFFVGVQISNLPLFFLCYWLSGFVFSFFMYTMVSLFANIGKAIGVLILIVQITGGGGSFPLQLLPSFFEWISPFLPATHVINAMRATMMGIYQNDFWIQIGTALLFVVPCIILGFFRPIFAKLMHWFSERAERSNLIS